MNIGYVKQFKKLKLLKTSLNKSFLTRIIALIIMKKFINMDYNGSQWWVEYIENNIFNKEYFDNEEDAILFYKSIVNLAP